MKHVCSLGIFHHEALALWTQIKKVFSYNFSKSDKHWKYKRLTDMTEHIKCIVFKSLSGQISIFLLGIWLDTTACGCQFSCVMGHNKVFAHRQQHRWQELEFFLPSIKIDD